MDTGNSKLTSELNSQEELMMEQITKNNRLMRRKLKLDSSDTSSSTSEHKSKRPSRRVPVRVYVKDAQEITTMRKKINDMEKLQNMYKERIDELENQVCNFSSFNAGPALPSIRPRTKKTSSASDGSNSSVSSGDSGLTIPVEPIITGLTRSQTQDQDHYERVSSKPHPDRTKLLALYDYTPTPDTKGRLAFKEGDILLLVSMKSRSGWWLTELNGKTGKVPSNYVEQLDPTRAFKARIIKNYDAQQPGDMTIQRGGIITVLKRQDNGWYLGEKGSKTGFFPSSCVERISNPSA